MFKLICKTVGVLTVLEVTLFFVMIGVNMTDQRTPAIGHYIYWTLKFILGFPIVLVNNDYPFFLDSREISPIAVLLITINNIILALIIIGIKRFFFLARHFSAEALENSSDEE